MLVIVSVLVAVAAVAAYAWRRLPALFSATEAVPGRARVELPSRPAPTVPEDFSAAERQSLEEILKRHGAGKTQ